LIETLSWTAYYYPSKTSVMNALRLLNIPIFSQFDYDAGVISSCADSTLVALKTARKIARSIRRLGVGPAKELSRTTDAASTPARME
jgi:hypothetical protein